VSHYTNQQVSEDGFATRLAVATGRFLQSGIDIGDVHAAATEWREAVDGADRLWLCWSVDPAWNVVQQRLVASVGWTPVVGYDPRTSIGFNKHLQLPTAWKLRGSSGEVDVAFREGAGRGCDVTIRVRPTRSMSPGIMPFRARDGVRRIVDRGANVGRSILWWLRHCPHAQSEAWESHSAHVARLRANVRLNAAEARVALHATASGTRPERLALREAGMSSAVVASGTTNAFPVEVVDVFGALINRPIDILRMDIEGSEWAILEDQRFASVPARALVVELHARAEHTSEHCTELLRSAGYDVRPLHDAADHGMRWGYSR
jgi:FkbM family methyltransferase